MVEFTQQKLKWSEQMFKLIFQKKAKKFKKDDAEPMVWLC